MFVSSRLSPCRVPAPVCSFLAPILLAAIFLVAIASAPPVAAADHLVALTTDFSTGSVSTCGLTPPWSTDFDVASICPDAVARYQGGLLYVVSRSGCDNIHVLDPGNGYATVRQFSVGIGSNPQDIAVVSPTRAYVTCYETEWLLEVNPATGTVVDSVSLGLFSDADGNPEMHRMQIWQNRLFIELQRLDRNNFYEPTDASYLAVLNLTTRKLIDIDPSTDVIDPIVLAGTNPSGPIEIDLNGGRLLVPTSGSFFDLTDGGIERVDPNRLEAQGFLVREADLGGNLLHFTQWRAQRAFAVISDASFATCVVAFDPHTGAFLDDLYCSDGFELADCVTAPEGYLYVADRDFFEPGVRVFDAESGVDLSGPLPVGLPPFELLVYRPAVSGAPSGPFAGAGVFPNPARTNVTLRWGAGASGASFGVHGTMSGAGEMSSSSARAVTIFDATGRRVRAIEASAAGEGEWVVEWDLRSEAGRRVPAGTYWARVGTAGSVSSTGACAITVLD